MDQSIEDSHSESGNNSFDSNNYEEVRIRKQREKLGNYVTSLGKY